MKRFLFTLPLMLALPAAAQQADPPTPASVVAAARADEWRAIAPQDLLVMDLAPDARGRERRVVIQLVPAPFSQPWVANIRTLARAHWWDGTQVYRVVDNWVAQWGDVNEQKPLPEGVASPIAAYHIPKYRLMNFRTARLNGSELTDRVFRGGADRLAQVATRIQETLGADAYALRALFVDGWPIGMSETGTGGQVWPIHCYGHVGVARDLAPDTGTGAELYAVIGHAPRQLDRNLAVVGRVIEGIEHLSTLPRGTAEAGVYAMRAEDTPIVSVRLASDMADPPAFEYLSTDSESFARYVAVRANRNDAFYTMPAGGVDICNVQVPIRPSTSSG